MILKAGHPAGGLYFVLSGTGMFIRTVTVCVGALREHHVLMDVHYMHVLFQVLIVYTGRP